MRYPTPSRAKRHPSIVLPSERPRLPGETYIQMTACGSLDLEVPRRNLRRWSLVSWEKV